MWTGFSEFTHGMFVPPLAAWLVWRDRAALARLPVRGSLWGLAAFALAVAVYVIGYLADIQYVGFFSVNLFLAALILWLLGVRWMRALAFPWLFLAFTWPWEFLDDYAFRLRLVMTHGSHFVLSLCGVPNVIDGTAIKSADDLAHGLREGARFAIDVADPCSGIRSLFALLMLSALVGHFMLRSPWKQGLLFLLAIPLAVAGNMARIVLLTFGTLLWGSRFAIGDLEHPTWFHEGAGFFVFAVALGGLWGAIRLLEKIPPMPWEKDKKNGAKDAIGTHL
jgi:exosortase